MTRRWRSRRDLVAVAEVAGGGVVGEMFERVSRSHCEVDADLRREGRGDQGDREVARRRESGSYSRHRRRRPRPPRRRRGPRLEASARSSAPSSSPPTSPGVVPCQGMWSTTRATAPRQRPSSPSSPPTSAAGAYKTPASRSPAAEGAPCVTVLHRCVAPGTRDVAPVCVAPCVHRWALVVHLVRGTLVRGTGAWHSGTWHVHLTCVAPQGAWHVRYVALRYVHLSTWHSVVRQYVTGAVSA